MVERNCPQYAATQPTSSSCGVVAGGGTGAGCGACFAKPDPLGPGGDDVEVAESRIDAASPKPASLCRGLPRHRCDGDRNATPMAAKIDIARAMPYLWPRPPATQKHKAPP